MGREKNDRRRHEPRHVRLYHSVTGSDAWLDLSGTAIKVYIALARFDGGSDNGALYMSARAGSDATGLSKNTVSRALTELEEHGFIAAVNRGHFSVKGGPATTWRLTDRPAPAAKPSAPTHAYRNWKRGNKTRSQNLSAAVPKVGTVLETRSHTVPNIGTAPLETPLVSVEPSYPNIGTQVVYHGDRVSELDSRRRKQPISDGGDFRLDVDIVGEVREQLLAVLNQSTPGMQTEIARKANIPGGTFSKFLSGRGLPPHHLISLQAVVASEAGQSKRRSASAA